MAQTSLGLIFLYELGTDDISRYRELRIRPLQRILWLLERIASRYSSDGTDKPATLTAAEVATLSPSEIESLFEIYLGSPRNQWFYLKSREADDGVIRSDGESAVAFFDRLIEWYAAFRHAVAKEVDHEPVAAGPAVRSIAAQSAPPDTELEAAPNEALARLASSMEASHRATQHSLKWAAGSLTVATIALACGAAWLGYQSHVRDRENDEKNAAWQQQMKMLAENNSAMERGFTEMATENARLKARLEMLERRPDTPPKASAPPAPRPAPAKTAAKPGRAPPRK